MIVDRKHITENMCTDIMTTQPVQKDKSNKTNRKYMDCDNNLNFNNDNYVNDEKLEAVHRKHNNEVREDVCTDNMPAQPVHKKICQSPDPDIEPEKENNSLNMTRMKTLELVDENLKDKEYENSDKEAHSDVTSVSLSLYCCD